MSERKDIRYIRDVLWPEFLAQFIEDNKEYPEERPLGARAEWHGMHRKVGKLQAPIWDGKPWTGRESVRRMFQEIIGHAFLAIASLDYEEAPTPQSKPVVEQHDAAWREVPNSLHTNIWACTGLWLSDGTPCRASHFGPYQPIADVHRRVVR